MGLGPRTAAAAGVILAGCLATGEDYDAMRVRLMDRDQDGYPASQYVDDYPVALAADCDDGDPAVHPAALEEPYDGVDNDCTPGTPDDDLDGDGAPLDADCDDLDPGVFEGNVEVYYDGIDQDCDPTNDDDQDGDGYDLDQECDDQDPQAFPGAQEVCDAADNDCDDRVDEGVDTWWVDADGDGFGSDAEGGIVSCSPDAGAVFQGGDCDDGDAAVSPDAQEVCNDLVDNDCDGTHAPCGWPPETDLDEADVVISGSEAGDHFGRVIQGGIDLTGDSVADLVVSAPGLDDGGSLQGAVYVFAGPISASLSVADAAATLTAPADENSVALGLDIVTIKSLGLAPAELVVVTTSGQAASFRAPLIGGLDVGDADDIYLDGATEFANSVFAPGDINNDLNPDLILGHSAASSDGVDRHGAARLFHRDEDGNVDDASPAATWLGDNAGDELGEYVAGADVNGDGFDDVIVSATGWDAPFQDAGAVFLFLGPAPATSLGDANGIRLGEASGDGCGTGLTPTHDLDGDGVGEVLIGAPLNDRVGTDGGSLYLVDDFALVSESSISTASAIVSGESTDDLIGVISGIGDFNGDRRPDVVVGAPASDALVTDAGGACVYLDGFSGANSLADCPIWLHGTVEGGLAGFDLFADDLDRDGLADLALGVTHPSGGETALFGTVHVIMGSGY